MVEGSKEEKEQRMNFWELRKEIESLYEGLQISHWYRSPFDV